MLNTELYYYLSFSHCLGIGPVKFDTLLKHFKSPRKAFEASHKELEGVIGLKLTTDFIDFRKRFDPVKKLEEMDAKNIHFLTREDKKYPKSLLKIPDPPIALYARGDMESIDFDNQYFFAIVGTRKPTSYGAQIAEKFAGELAQAGFIIVSGLAMGIDAASHKGALESRGKTIAVLGCGVDIVYPLVNSKLYDQIVREGGLILSEFPPGMVTLPGLFVARNRIISGLSQGVMVVEGLENSGSLITARYAAEQGKEVFAPPAPLTSAMSYVPNLLLREGAKLVTKASDILDEFHLAISPAKQKALTAELSQEEKTIVSLLSTEPKLIDIIASEAQIKVDRLAQTISIMEVKGIIKKNSEGKYQMI